MTRARCLAPLPCLSQDPNLGQRQSPGPGLGTRLARLAEPEPGASSEHSTVRLSSQFQGGHRTRSTEAAEARARARDTSSEITQASLWPPVIINEETSQHQPVFLVLSPECVIFLFVNFVNLNLRYKLQTWYTLLNFKVLTLWIERSLNKIRMQYFD